MTLFEHLAALAEARKSLAENPDGSAAHRFAASVDALGYFDESVLARAKVRHAALIREAVAIYEARLARHPRDAVAMNNIGVFRCNSGKTAEARRWFARALRLDSTDAHIRENLGIADILLGKAPESRGAAPRGLKRGKWTLLAYFDPHGM